MPDAPGRGEPVNAESRIEQPATRENLALFLEFIDAFSAAIDADTDTRYALRIAVEEVCINLINYGYAGRDPGPIAILAQRVPEGVALTIRDQARPFDPASAPPPDLTGSVESRVPGGLGWYLVRQLMDKVEYAADPRAGNTLTLLKRAPA